MKKTRLRDLMPARPTAPKGSYRTGFQPSQVANPGRIPKKPVQRGRTPNQRGGGRRRYL